MKILDLIKQLNSAHDNVGNVDVYVNGEHGIGECELLDDRHVSLGSANILFDTDNIDIVCHIGGC